MLVAKSLGQKRSLHTLFCNIVKFSYIHSKTVTICLFNFFFLLMSDQIWDFAGALDFFHILTSKLSHILMSVSNYRAWFIVMLRNFVPAGKILRIG